MDVMEARRNLLNQPKRILVTWNQLAPAYENGNWEPYVSSRISLSYDDGVMTAYNIKGGSGDNQSVRNTNNPILLNPTDIHFCSAMINPSFANAKVCIEYGGAGDRENVYPTPQNTWTRINKIMKMPTSVRTDGRIYFPEWAYGNGPSAGDTAQFKSMIIVNLTTMFGSGNEPSLDEFERQCRMNNIDLTQFYPRDTNGTQRWWII